MNLLFRDPYLLVIPIKALTRVTVVHYRARSLIYQP
jgi:hypothetical protein